MALEIAPIERSRARDSQAWCIFFSQLVLEKKLEPIKVMPYWENDEFSYMCCTEIKDPCDLVSINSLS